MIKIKKQNFKQKFFFRFFLISFVSLLAFPVFVKATLDPSTTLAPAPAITITSQQTVTGAGIDSTGPVKLYVPAGQTPVNNTSLNSTQRISLNNSTGLSCGTPKDIGALFDYGKCILGNGIVPLIIGLAVIIFLIGIAQYITSGDNEEKKEASRNLMLYGIISIFVMVSVWGFVNILTNTFFGSNAKLPNLPPSATTNP
ncbi:MAG: pilin [bacterium]